MKIFNLPNYPLYEENVIINDTISFKIKLQYCQYKNNELLQNPMIDSRWFFDIEYKLTTTTTFSRTGLLVSLSDNLISKYKNILPFFISCYTNEAELKYISPCTQNAFSDNYYTLIAGAYDEYENYLQLIDNTL